MFQRLAFIILISVLLISCATSPSSAQTPVAIGDTEIAFFAAYGSPPNSYSSILEGVVNGHNVSFDLGTQSDPSGQERVTDIELRVYTDNPYGSDEVWSPDFECTMVSTLFPADATYLHDINPYGSVYHIYHSDSLAVHIPASWFIHDNTLAPTGTFWWWCRDEAGYNSMCKMGLGDYGP